MKFRIDIVGLSEETKPTTGIEDGTTYYTVDTQEFYIYYKGTWYKQGEQEETPAEDDDTEPAEESDPEAKGDEMR